MKVITTYMTYNGLDEMRQSCGGAGFLVASGICSQWQEIAPFPTFEGVSVVMLQQSARYLFKQAERVGKGKKCEGYFAYISDTERLCSSRSGARTVEDFLSWEHLTAALSTQSAFYIRYVDDLIKNDSRPKKEKENEVYALEVQKMAKYHLNYSLYEMAKKRINEHDFKDASIRPALHTVVKLFAVKQLMDDSECLYETGFFGAGSGKLRDEAFKKLLNDLRPNMLGLLEFCPNFEEA